MWQTLRKEEVLRNLGTNEKTGLTEEEVQARQAKYGKNKLKDKKKEKPPPLRNFFVKVVTNFYNVLIIFEVKNRIYKYSINIGFLSLFFSSFLSIKDSFLFSFFARTHIHASKSKRERMV